MSKNLADKKLKQRKIGFFSYFLIPLNRLLNIIESFDEVLQKFAYKRFNKDFEKYKKKKEQKAQLKLDKSLHFLQVIKGGELTLLIMEYEKALAYLVKEIFKYKPEIINSFDREIHTRKVWEFQTIDEIKDFIINEEIDLLLRKNSFEQIRWIEGKFDCKINLGEKFWDRLFLFSEQRNLFIHNDNKVTQEYIDKFKKYYPNEKAPEKGKKLNLAQNDLLRCALYIIEALYSINRLLCKKYLQDEFISSSFINNTFIYEKFIKNKKLIYLAPFIIRHILSLDSDIEDHHKGLLLINKALAEKLIKDKRSFSDTLIEIEKISKSNDKNLLPIALLKDDYDSVESILSKMKSNKKTLNFLIKQKIFDEYRKTERFKKFYSSTFKMKANS